jgi:hypothetical protein
MRSNATEVRELTSTATLVISVRAHDEQQHRTHALLLPMHASKSLFRPRRENVRQWESARHRIRRVPVAVPVATAQRRTT